MSTLADLRAARLRAALDEACCDACGALKRDSCCGAQYDLEDDNVAEAKKKKKPVSKGPGGEHHTHAFIQRCVAAITKDQPGMDTSRAFAICTSAKKKHPSAAKEKAKEGVKGVKGYEKALKKGREESASLATRIVSAITGA